LLYIILGKGGKKRSSLNTLQSSSTMNSLLFSLFIPKFPQILTLLYLKSLMSKYLFIFLSLSLRTNTLILLCDAICARYGIHQLNQSRRNVSGYLTMNRQQRTQHQSWAVCIPASYSGGTSSNHSLQTAYPEWGFSQFYSAPSNKCRESSALHASTRPLALVAQSCHILSESFQISTEFHSYCDKYITVNVRCLTKGGE